MAHKHGNPQRQCGCQESHELLVPPGSPHLKRHTRFYLPRLLKTETKLSVPTVYFIIIYSFFTLLDLFN